MKKINIMTKIVAGFCVALGVLISGCAVSVGTEGVVGVGVDANVAVAPAVVVYPDYYAWDGVEYVGVHGDRYFYLNPGGAWVVADPVILGRFHGWERYHADWRRTATRYSPGQRIERRDREVVQHDRAVEHREVQKKTPPPQNKKAAPGEKKKEPPKSSL